MAILPDDPKQQGSIVALVAVVAGLYAFWTYWYSPKQEEIATMQDRVERLETQNRRARVMATQGRQELESKLAAYERHISELEKLIPESEEVPQLLDDMALEARQRTVDLALMQPEPPTPGEFYTRRTYSMGVIGSYHHVGSFLASIASLSRIIRPIDLEVEPGPTRTDESGEPVHTIQATFRIETYVLPEGGREPASQPAESAED